MQPEADPAYVMCDYCDENPTPAVKTCLKCETSFCSRHLKPHLLKEDYKDHTLIDPVPDVTEIQCRDHKKVLEFYCKEDAECVCGPCSEIGKHRSHTLLSLNQGQAAIKTRIKELKGKLSKSFSEWRRQLEEDEEYALTLIDEEGLRALAQIRSCSEALNKRMEQITLIDGETQSLVQRDPLSFIQNSKQLLSRVTETQRVTDPDGPALTLNLFNISQLIQERLNGWEKYHSDILGIIRQSSQLSLDPKTANCSLVLSDDLRSVTYTEQDQPYPPHPERFTDYFQVICSQSFSSGSHSWDGESDGKEWGMGIVYGSIDRKGQYSWFGESSNSWCLYPGTDSVTFWHDNERTDLPPIGPGSRIRVQLDYEAGTVSFHQVTDSLIHLYTFHTTFTEPVFPAFGCWDKSIKLLN
uniref:E3 ubiquitin/ISG15 ligase TRIM25-like isoform X2 n=1 Tax=Pristiophorus japonicus TaxID=55135 RepID=UPI00398F1E62